MKHPGYTIKIDKPCTEDWSQMESASSGRFCAHCQHSVIDFSRLTDSQVIAIIEKTQGKICGRFNNQQLNRIMQHTEPSQNPALYKILAAMLLLSTTNTVLAESPKAETTIITPVVTDNALSPDTIPRKLLISGHVYDTLDAMPIPFATVLLMRKGESTKLGTNTDFDGKFELVVPANLVDNSSYLQISYIGFITKKMVLNKQPLTDLRITLLEDPNPEKYMMMGAMNVIDVSIPAVQPPVSVKLLDDIVPLDVEPKPLKPKNDVP